MLTATDFALLGQKAPNESLAKKLHATKTTLCAIYDFAVQGGATGDVKLLDDQGNPAELPLGAIITNVIAHAIAAVTTSDSGTLALKANSSADLMTAKADSALTLNALAAGVPVGTAATAVRLTAKRRITGTIANNLTAGKVAFYIDYWLPPVA